MFNLKARGKHVIVKVADGETTIGSFVVIASELRNCKEGFIVDVGPDVKDLSIGARVVYGKYSGSSVGVDVRTFDVLREEDVIARLEDDGQPTKA